MHLQLDVGDPNGLFSMEWRPKNGDDDDWVAFNLNDDPVGASPHHGRWPAWVEINDKDYRFVPVANTAGGPMHLSVSVNFNNKQYRDDVKIFVGDANLHILPKDFNQGPYVPVGTQQRFMAVKKCGTVNCDWTFHWPSGGDGLNNSHASLVEAGQDHIAHNTPTVTVNAGDKACDNQNGVTLWTNIPGTETPPTIDHPANEADYKFTIFKAALKEVTFTGAGYHTVSKDDGTGAYGTPQWQDNSNPLNGNADNPSDGDHKYPICYTRNTKVKATVKIVAEPAAAFAQGKISGSTSYGISFSLADAAVNGNEFTVTNIESASALPNTVKYYESFEIDWHLSPDGVNYCYAGTSKNQAYVTLGNPVEGITMFHTVVHIGCVKANGMTVDSKHYTFEIISKIFEEFEDRIVKRVDGTQLTYWVGNDPPATTAGLLHDGDGRCGAWMRFFDDCLRAQGISGTQRLKITTKDLPNHNPPLFGVGFLVKNMPGQGNNTPRRSFADHALLKYFEDGMVYEHYYDPSYGKRYTSLLEWEDDAIESLYYKDNVPPDPPPGTPEYQQPNPAGTQETESTDSN